MKTNSLLKNAALMGIVGLTGLGAASPSLWANDLFGPDWVFDVNSNGTVCRETAPAVNLSENAKEYIVRADLPGMKKEDVNVTFDRGILTIAGERKMTDEEKGAKSRFSETFYGQFSRSFSLPEDADANKVTASFRDGVLWIHIQKNPALKAKTIEIR